MIKIAVCDDEEVMCEKMKYLVSRFLDRHREAYTVTCYSNGVRLLFSPADFDLIFLDIQMPGMDGMTVAGKLRQKGFAGVLIFVTVAKEYMPDAFAVEAGDYLCKPVDKQRLEAALERSLKRLRSKSERSLVIQTVNWCRSIRVRDIYYCEVIDRKIYIHTRDGIMDYYGKMKELEKKAGSWLFKCHRSYLINLDCLWEYRNGTAILENGEQIPVSKSCHQALMERMMQYMDEEE